MRSFVFSKYATQLKTENPFASQGRENSARRIQRAAQPGRALARIRHEFGVLHLLSKPTNGTCLPFQWVDLIEAEHG